MTYSISSSSMPTCSDAVCPDPASAPAPEFYASSTKNWRNEQKASPERCVIACRQGRTVECGGGTSSGGARGCLLSRALHTRRTVLPQARSCEGGFVSSHSSHPRWGLAHVLRRQADWYICGHQHLMAHMRLKPSGFRPVEETRCHFTIVGNSSKTEQDLGDFDD